MSSTTNRVARLGSTLPPSCLRILVAILRLRQERGYLPSIREIAKECGWIATNWVWHVLRRLRAAGLIDFAGFRGRTVVPRCRVEVYAETTD